MTWQVSPWQASLQAAFVSIWGAEGSPISSLDLNFTLGSLDPRITYSGASLATLTDAAGAIAYKPHNLLTYSEQFDNAIWAKTTASVTANSAAAPDGTSTADKLVEDTTASTAHFIANTVTVSSGVPHTLSVYLKAAGRSWVGVYETSSACGKYFNLATGVVGSDLGSAPAAFAITDVGNGWFRCSIKVTTASTSSTFRVFAANADGGITYSGDGTSGVYIWGAQFNVGPLQPYYPTTSAAYFGPRFTYDPITLNPLGLLIEEQRTNLLLWSEAFDNAAWISSGMTISANSIAAPDGATTADQITLTNGSHSIRQNPDVTVTASTQYTLSFYAYRGTATDAKYAVFDNTHAAYIVTSTSFFSQTSGSGWSRVTLTFTTPAGCTSIRPVLLSDSGVTGTIYLWGTQLEAGAFATSYIPTTSASVTRAADSATMTGSNFSSWFNATQGTFVAQFVVPSLVASTYKRVFSARNVADTERVEVWVNGAGTVRIGSTTGGSTTETSLVAAVSAGQVCKVAASYTASGMSASLNGGTVYTHSATVNGAVMTVLDVGLYHAANHLCAPVSRLRYYNTALTNAQLQALTT